MKVRSYSELRQFDTLEERFDYLKLDGSVGKVTFGYERYLNQRFYTSSQWKSIRNEVIARDLGLNLGIEGNEIYDKIIIHHMNPITPEDIHGGNEQILSPEFLICTNHKTHNAIHYGDSSLQVLPFPERRAGDTTLWGNRALRSVA
jgi:hypothetical protein